MATMIYFPCVFPQYREPDYDCRFAEHAKCEEYWPLWMWGTLQYKLMKENLASDT
jgi:hypothetical protein